MEETTGEQRSELVRAAVVGMLVSVPAWKLWDLTQDCEGLACIGNVLVVIVLAPLLLPLLAWLGFRWSGHPRALVAALLATGLAALWSYPLGALWWDPSRPFANPTPPLLALLALDAALFAASAWMLRRPWAVRGWVLAGTVVAPLVLGTLVHELSA